MAETTLLDVMQLAKRKGQAVFPKWFVINGVHGRYFFDNRSEFRRIALDTAALIGDGCMTKWLASFSNGFMVSSGFNEVGADGKEGPALMWVVEVDDIEHLSMESFSAALIAAVVARLNDMPDLPLADPSQRRTP